MLKKINIRVIVIFLLSVFFWYTVFNAILILILTYSAVIFVFTGDLLRGFRSAYALLVIFVFSFLLIFRFCSSSVKNSVFTLWAGYRTIVVKKRFFNIFNKYKYEKITPDHKPFINKLLPFFIWLILLCVFSSIAVNFITSKIISRKTEEMKQNGYPTSFSDFDRNIPEEQNAAKPLDNVSILASVRLKTFFEDSLNSNTKLEALVYKKWDVTKKKQSEIILSTCSYIFNEAESIFGKYKYYQYTDYKEVGKEPFKIKDAYSIFPLQQLFLLRARFNFKRGNYNLFWKDIENNLKLYVLVSQDKNMFAQMTSLGIISKTVEVIINSMKDKPELVCPQNIINELLKIRKENPAFEGLKFNMVREMEGLKYFSRGDRTKKISFLKYFLAATSIRNLNLIAIMNYETELLSLHSLSPKNIEKEGQLLDEKLRKLPFFPFLWSMIPPSHLDSFYLKEAEIDTKVQILAVATAIRKYKMLNKKYPQKLSELVPKYLTSDLIIDQFSEKELVYKLTENKFLLYSIGRNFKDDNGTFGYYKSDNDIGVLIN